MLIKLWKSRYSLLGSHTSIAICHPDDTSPSIIIDTEKDDIKNKLLQAIRVYWIEKYWNTLLIHRYSCKNDECEKYFKYIRKVFNVIKPILQELFPDMRIEVKNFKY